MKPPKHTAHDKVTNGTKYTIRERNASVHVLQIHMSPKEVGKQQTDRTAQPARRGTAHMQRESRVVMVGRKTKSEFRVDRTPASSNRAAVTHYSRTI